MPGSRRARCNWAPTPYDLARPQATAALRGKRMAMIFQDPFASLNPVFSVQAHLNEVLTRRWPDLDHANRRNAAAEALAQVGIDRPELRLGQYPHELSGGMRQRVAIAMALLARPDLLIADEPTTALDATVEAQVMQEICALRDRIGCSILLITHSLGLVAQYCDDIAVMYAGELVEQGSVAKVAANPGHPYTRALLACEVTIDTPRGKDARHNRFRMIPGDLPDPMNRPSGCIFRPRCDIAIADCARIVPPPVRGRWRSRPPSRAASGVNVAMNTAISIRDARLRFGHTQALDGVSVAMWRRATASAWWAKADRARPRSCE